jgi:hypothetical protein
MEVASTSETSVNFCQTTRCNNPEVISTVGCLFGREDYRNNGHNPEKTVLGLSPSLDRFCCLETKHNKRTAQRPKSFISAGKLQAQRLQPRKSVLGSSPGEDGVCSLENRHLLVGLLLFMFYYIEVANPQGCRSGL